MLAGFGHLLLPGRLLVVRDLPFLHLPLRETFAALFAAGGWNWPDWNPLIHGGQPILSNPHYAAWYPATWLGLVVPVRWALHLSVLAHAALAFAGAWRLLARLGAERPGRAFAALAYAGGGFFVALTHTLLIFTGMAWTPWVLAGADGWLRSERRSARGLAAAALPLGFQILNGDPASVGVSVVLVTLLALDAARRRGSGPAGRRLGAALLLALALGSIQLVPTWMRLRESSRGAGLSLADAAVWSTRPARLLEMAFPTVHGEAARDEENLYFGWTLHDRQFPLLISIYPGFLALCLGIAGGFRPKLPRRGVWIAGAAMGVFLGLGRHNPLFAAAHAVVPFFGMVRYPEKFLLLTLVCLVVSAALQFDRIVGTGYSIPPDRSPGARSWRELNNLSPQFLAAVAALAAAARLGWVWAAPEGVGAWMERACGFALAPAVEAAGLSYLRREALLSLVVTATATLLLLALRGQRHRSLAALALLFLATDNWVYSRRFNPTLPLEEFVAPPLAAALPAGERIFNDVAFYRGPAVGLPVGRRGFHQITVRLDRLEPYSATLWGQQYVLHEDYDLMLTAWARHALGLLHEEWPDVERRSNVLGAWNAGTLVRVRSPAEIKPELDAWRRLPEAERRRQAAAPAPARLERNPAVLPRVRLAPAVEAHGDLAAAVAAARGDDFDARRREHLVLAPAAGPAWPAAPGEILGFDAGTDERRLRYRAGQPATIIVAETYDVGWTASDDDGETTFAIVPTALGQMAIRVPAAAEGRGVVRLAYRDPWVRVGAALTLLGLLALAFAVLREGREGREGANV